MAGTSLELRQAERQNATPRFAREQRRRQTIVEGVFARLDRLGGTRARFRGLSRVGSYGRALCAIAHNILKALTKVRYGRRVAGALPRPAATPSFPVLLLLRLICRSRRRFAPYSLLIAGFRATGPSFSRFVAYAHSDVNCQLFSDTTRARPARPSTTHVTRIPLLSSLL